MTSLRSKAGWRGNVSMRRQSKWKRAVTVKVDFSEAEFRYPSEVPQHMAAVPVWSTAVAEESVQQRLSPRLREGEAEETTAHLQDRTRYLQRKVDWLEKVHDRIVGVFARWDQEGSLSTARSESPLICWLTFGEGRGKGLCSQAGHTRDVFSQEKLYHILGKTMTMMMMVVVVVMVMVMVMMMAMMMVMMMMMMMAMMMVSMVMIAVMMMVMMMMIDDWWLVIDDWWLMMLMIDDIDDDDDDDDNGDGDGDGWWFMVDGWWVDGMMMMMVVMVDGWWMMMMRRRRTRTRRRSRRRRRRFDHGAMKTLTKQQHTSSGTNLRE